MEAELGPQSDIEQFVKSALPVDYLLHRFKIETSSVRYPVAYDKETGRLFCYFNTRFQGGMDLWWSINTKETFQVWKNYGDLPDFGKMDIDVLEKTYFPNWQGALGFLLKDGRVQAFVNDQFKIGDDMLNQAPVEERLEALTQALAKRGFMVQRIGSRAGKALSCYAIGEGSVTTPDEAAQTLQEAAKACCLVVENTQAALRSERSWQIDFKCLNLLENHDLDDFVQTTFRGSIPGYAEQERLVALKDALRKHGLPVHRITVQAFPFTQADTDDKFTEIKAYWDNQVTNYSPGKSNEMGVAALKEVPSYEVNTLGTYGHGYNRHLAIMVKAVGVPTRELGAKDFYFESDDMEAFASVAAARSGTIGDELRLKRLVDYLGTLGIKCKEASLAQRTSMGGQFLNYLVVEYRLSMIRANRLPLEDSLARHQLQQIVCDFLNQDRETSGAGPQPFSDIRVEGGHNKWSGFTVTVMATSLRKPTGVPFERMDTRKLNLEGIEDEYAALAIRETPGLRTRMWMRAMRKELESKGFTVRNIHAVQWSEKMRVIAHINAYSNSLEPEYQKFKPEPVIQAWYDAVKATGNHVVTDAGEETRITADRTVGPIHPLIYTIKGFVGSLEPERMLPQGTRMDEAIISLDDFGFGHREVAWSLAIETERLSSNKAGVRPVKVVWVKADPTEEKWGYPEGTVLYRGRLVCQSRGDASWAWAKAVLAMGNVEHTDAQHGYGMIGILEGPPGCFVCDMYAYIRANEQLVSPQVIRGPSYERFKDYDGGLTECINETLDADDEVWVRNVVEKTPGVRDLGRLKSALRLLEEMGYDITGATQGPVYGSKLPRDERQDNMCSVLVAFLMPPHSASRDVDRIYEALAAYWDIHKIDHHYDTTDKQHRVIEWQWRSHDSPQTMVPLHLRMGDWQEYLSSGLHCYELDTFLVEQFDTPGDEPGPEMFSIDKFVSDIVDPLWHERMRLRAIADDIKAAGWDGNLHLQGKETNINSPTLWFNLWKGTGLPQNDMPDNEAMHLRIQEEGEVRQLIRDLNKKYHFSSDGNIWARLHDMRNQIAAKRPGKSELGNVYAWTVSFPYMWASAATPELVKSVPIQKAQVHVPVNEALEWNPREMAGFARVAARPDKRLAVQMAWKAFLACFKKNFPNAPGYANFMQEPQPGGFSRFEFYVKFEDEVTYEQVKRDYALRTRIQDLFRNAVLEAGLKRFMPRRTMYYKWPAVDLYVEQETMLGVICKFSLKNLTVPDETKHIGNVHDEIDESEDLEGFVTGALPDIEDRKALEAFIADLAADPMVAGGEVIFQPKVSQGRIFREKKRYPKVYGADMDIILKDASQTGWKATDTRMSTIGHRIAYLLTKHGFGKHEWDSWSMVGGVSGVQYNFINGDQGWHIRVRNSAISKAAKRQVIKFGQMPEGLLDPSEFMASAEKEAPYMLLANMRRICAVMKQKGWIGTVRCRSWRGSGTMHEITFDIAKTEGGPGPTEQVEKDTAAALQGLYVHPADGIRVFYQAQKLRGYAEEYPGFWHWTADAIVDMQGSFPVDHPQSHSSLSGDVIVIMDIGTGGYYLQ